MRLYCLKDVELTRRLYEIAEAIDHKHRFVEWQLQQISDKINSIKHQHEEGELADHLPESYGSRRIPSFDKQLKVAMTVEAFDEECRTLFEEVKAYIENHGDDVQRYLWDQAHHLRYARDVDVPNLIKNWCDMGSSHNRDWQARYLLFTSSLRSPYRLTQVLESDLKPLLDPLINSDTIRLARDLPTLLYDVLFNQTYFITRGYTPAGDPSLSEASLYGKCVAFLDQQGHCYTILEEINADIEDMAVS